MNEATEAFVHLIPDDCPDCTPTKPCCSVHDECNDEGIAHPEPCIDAPQLTSAARSRIRQATAEGEAEIAAATELRSYPTLHDE